MYGISFNFLCGRDGRNTDAGYKVSLLVISLGNVMFYCFYGFQLSECDKYIQIHRTRNSRNLLHRKKKVNILPSTTKLIPEIQYLMMIISTEKFYIADKAYCCTV